MKKIGTWWNDSSIEIVEISGTAYALNDWNGEAYTSCWICSGEYLHDASEEEYTLRPVYRFQDEGIDLNVLEENSAEWEHAIEVVDYDVYTN